MHRLEEQTVPCLDESWRTKSNRVEDVRAAVLSTGSIDSASVVIYLIFKVTRSSVDLGFCAIFGTTGASEACHDHGHAKLVEPRLGVCSHSEIIWVKIVVFKESLAYISLNLA